jgi:hypothetical protein
VRRDNAHAGDDDDEAHALLGAEEAQAKSEEREL